MLQTSELSRGTNYYNLNNFRRGVYQIKLKVKSVRFESD